MPSSSGMRRLFASGPFAPLQAVATRPGNARQQCECFFICHFLPLFVLRECNPSLV